jgi:hypothetical protein
MNEPFGCSGSYNSPFRVTRHPGHHGKLLTTIVYRVASTVSS